MTSAVVFDRIGEFDLWCETGVSLVRDPGVSLDLLTSRTRRAGLGACRVSPISGRVRRRLLAVIVFHVRLRIAPRRPAHRRPPGRGGAPGRRALSGVPGARRRASSRSCRARRGSRSTPRWRWRCSSRRCCSTRRTTPRRGISGTTGSPSRSLAVVSVVLTTLAVAVVARALVPEMPWAAGDRARRHRLAARRRRGDGGAAPAPAAASHPDDPRRREPVERRERPADLPAGRRSGRGATRSPSDPSRRRSCSSWSAASSWGSAARPWPALG